MYNFDQNLNKNSGTINNCLTLIVVTHMIMKLHLLSIVFFDQIMFSNQSKNCKLERSCKHSKSSSHFWGWAWMMWPDKKVMVPAPRSTPRRRWDWHQDLVCHYPQKWDEQALQQNIGLFFFSSEIFSHMFVYNKKHVTCVYIYSAMSNTFIQ